MAQRKFLFQRAIGRHPVIVTPRQIADFRIKRSPHGDVHFLKTAANPEKRLPAFNTGPHKRQGDGIARAVEFAMRIGRHLAVMFGMHVRAPPRQQETVTDVQQFFNGNKAWISGNQHRHTARHP